MQNVSKDHEIVTISAKIDVSHIPDYFCQLVFYAVPSKKRSSQREYIGKIHACHSNVGICFRQRNRPSARSDRDVENIPNTSQQLLISDDLSDRIVSWKETGDQFGE